MHLTSPKERKGKRSGARSAERQQNWALWAMLRLSPRGQRRLSESPRNPEAKNVFGEHQWQVFCYPAPVQPQLLFSYSQVFFIIIINYINLCCRNLFKLRKTHPFSLEMLGSWNFQEEQRRNSFPENIKPFLSFTLMVLNTRFLVHFSVGFFFLLLLRDVHPYRCVRKL